MTRSYDPKRDDLIRESWQIYRRFVDQSFVAKPSIPILFFGDSGKYFDSKLKVITVGLNPSKKEFQEEFKRFSSASGIYPGILEGASYDEYLQALNGYFLKPPNDPYKLWFNSYEPVLSGLDCSYYGNAPNTALHTDLCSPLATHPTWTRLQREERISLTQLGTHLWHSLVEWLSPNLIIASVARSHLSRITFLQQNSWKIVYTIQRTKPYNVELTKLKMPNGQVASLIFGKAANMPFGTVSNADKRKIGLTIKNYIYDRPGCCVCEPDIST
jgi:hypothetical protein